MKCLLCNLNFITDETLRTHYIWHHLINANNEFFEDLFLPDNNLKRCEKCMIEFKNCRSKKNHIFLFHYNQSGGSTTNQQLPINVLKRGPITYFSVIINQQQGEIITSENKRVWLTNVYTAKHFNQRLILNGETGSTWTFKRFQRLQIITTSFESSKSIISS